MTKYQEFLNTARIISKTEFLYNYDFRIFL